MNKDIIVKKLISEGKKLLDSPKKEINYKTDIAEAENLLNDIVKHPHIFVLACVMDRQIKAERAWSIPYLVGKEISSYKFSEFLKLSLPDVKRIFNKKKLHRFNDMMSENFYSAIQDIHLKYNGDASMIWTGNLQSALIIRRFLEFRGVGIKIATMAVNILARNYKVSMTEYSSIDISPDVQVKKFFIKNGLLRENASNVELIYLAREIYPKYPGILDIAAWEGGRLLR